MVDDDFTLSGVGFWWSSSWSSSSSGIESMRGIVMDVELDVLILFLPSWFCDMVGTVASVKSDNLVSIVFGASPCFNSNDSSENRTRRGNVKVDVDDVIDPLNVIAGIASLIVVVCGGAWTTVTTDDDEEEAARIGRCMTTVSIVLATDDVEVMMRLRESIVDNVNEDCWIESYFLFCCSVQDVAIVSLYWFRLSDSNSSVVLLVSTWRLLILSTEYRLQYPSCANKKSAL